MVIRFLIFIFCIAIGIAFIVKYLLSIIKKLERDEDKMYQAFDKKLNPDKDKDMKRKQARKQIERRIK